MGGHGPFRGLEAPLALAAVYGRCVVFCLPKHIVFDYIEGRWGPDAIRRFIDALIVPRVARTYDAVFELTPAQFDAAFRQYAERRFKPAVR